MDEIFFLILFFVSVSVTSALQTVSDSCESKCRESASTGSTNGACRSLAQTKKG